MIKKKGSIVPRYLVDAIEKKSQHLIKFGCDVEIEGNTVTAIGKGSSIFVIPREKYCNLKKNKGTQKRKWKGCVIGNNIKINGDCKVQSLFYVHSDNPSEITIQSPIEISIL